MTFLFNLNQGDGLDELSVDDYAVDVSSGHCDIVSITRNVLQCYPPQKEPPADSETSSQGHLVVVRQLWYLPVGIHYSRSKFGVPGINIILWSVNFISAILCIVPFKNTEHSEEC